VSDSNKKGRVLEDAVTFIEKTIMATDPSVAGRDIRVEARKVVVDKSVRREIDLWVELRAAQGYGSLFIFECKNWSDKVGASEVVLLSAKIGAVQAQRGFLVARAFTTDARAQAALDERVELLEVREEEYAWLTSPFTFNFAEFGLGTFSVEYGVSDPSHAGAPIDPSSAVAVLDGNPVDLSAYIREWWRKVYDETVAGAPHFDLPGGTYELPRVDQREFAPGALTVNGIGIAGIRLRVRPTVRVVWPSIVSSVEVVGRGRVLKLEPVFIGGKEVSASILGLADEADPDRKPLSPPGSIFVEVTMAPPHQLAGEPTRVEKAASAPEEGVIVAPGGRAGQDPVP
jgi:hypothetical protein